MLRHHALPCEMSQANKILKKHLQLCQLFLARAWEPLHLASRSALDWNAGLWVPPTSQHPRTALPSMGRLSSPEAFPAFPLLLPALSYLLNKVCQAALAQPSPDPCPGSIPCKTNRSVSAEPSGVIKAIQQRQLHVTSHWTLPNLLGP